MSEKISRGPLLDLLAETAKEDAGEADLQDERWQRLTAGTLNPEESAALSEEASSSVAARRMYETYQPLGEDFQNRVVGALLSQPGGGAATPRRLLEESAEIKPRKGMPLVRRRRAWAAVASVAAALLVVLLMSRSRPSLPEYRLTLDGGVSGERGAVDVAESPPRFQVGSRWQVLLRPAMPTEGKVSVACFLAQGDHLQAWDPPVEVSESGSVRLHGQIGKEPSLDSGSWTLWVAVGRPGELPDTPELRDRLSTSGPKDTDRWSLHRADFVIVPRK